jgi:hypothetical protein
MMQSMSCPNTSVFVDTGVCIMSVLDIAHSALPDHLHPATINAFLKASSHLGLKTITLKSFTVINSGLKVFSKNTLKYLSRFFWASVCLLHYIPKENVHFP